ncbi:hypothetical protein AD998_06100 [bacterium 336/3]|nr:hypothetical protein AD998_06100 [bacterium 336/3]
MLKNHKIMILQKWIGRFILGMIFYLHTSMSFAQTKNNMDELLPCRFIYEINVAIKSKRPDKNGEPVWKYALLYTCKEPNEIEVQRQVITVKLGKTTHHREIVRVEKIFDTQEDAYAYAEMNRVMMAYFKDNKERVDNVPSMRENGISPSDIRTDWIITDIEQKLPKDWEIVQTEDDKKSFPQKFTIRARYKVWKTNLNLINASKEVIQKSTEEEFIKKNGKEVTPLIQFALHQPWREIELKNVAYNESNWQYYYANAQYFGLKVVTLEGIGGQLEQIYPPKNVETTPLQVYTQIRELLTPKTFKGIAQNAKLGAVLINEGKTYFIDDRKGNWATWTDDLVGKMVVLEGVEIVRITQKEPLVNEKGEYKAGSEGGRKKYLLNVSKTNIKVQSEIIGIAQNANIGKIVGVSRKEDDIACIMTEKGEIFYIDGLKEWDYRFLGKRVGVSGFIEKKAISEPTARIDRDKGLVKAKEQTTKDYNFLTDSQLPKLEKTPSLVVVFKKGIAKNVAKTIMEATKYPYWEGMDSSKGKVYFSKTGEKYHILFPNDAELKAFQERYKNTPEIYEIYIPDWNIQKD